MENTETKEQVKSLVRIGEKKVGTYKDASQLRELGPKVKGVLKTKIFARRDGTYDVVWYGKPEVEKKKEATEEMGEKKQHGLTAKERRAAEKK